MHSYLGRGGSLRKRSITSVTVAGVCRCFSVSSLCARVLALVLVLPSSLVLRGAETLA